MKIGKSKDVLKRLEFISTHCPFPVQIVAILRDVPSRQEFLLHRKFAHFRQHGEWFLETAELRYYYLNPYILDEPEGDEDMAEEREMIEREGSSIREILSAQLRKRMAISKKDVKTLARDSEVSAAAIYRILDCSRGASVDTIAALADALDVPPAVLLMPLE